MPLVGSVGFPSRGNPLPLAGKASRRIRSKSTLPYFSFPSVTQITEGYVAIYDLFEGRSGARLLRLSSSPTRSKRQLRYATMASGPRTDGHSRSRMRSAAR